MTMEDQTVFVVDDDHAACDALARSLTARGYQVEHFYSARTFLDAFGKGRPGCLVLDYGMPDMNGLELQSHLADVGAKLPIIFVTGHGGIPESVLATKAGALDFLEKPYVPATLQKLVDQALAEDEKHRSESAANDGALERLGALTPRETEIFRMMLARPGQCSSKALARILGGSPRTIDIHRKRILDKTECRSVAELVTVYRGAFEAAGEAIPEATEEG